MEGDREDKDRAFENNLSQHYSTHAADHFISSFNYIIKEGLKTACLDLDPVYTQNDDIKISISDVRMAELNLPMDRRKNKQKVYPSEAGIRGTTYFAEFIVELEFELKDLKVYAERVFFVPLMVKSDLCYLSGASEEELILHKEDPFDPGGYFIVNGNEYILRQFMVPRRNYPLAVIDFKFTKFKKGYTEYGIVIRSVKDDHLSREISLHFAKNGSMELRFYYKKRPCFISLSLLLKALVDETDTFIVSEILRTCKDRSLKQCMVNMFRMHLKQNIQSHRQALDFIGQELSDIMHLPKLSHSEVTNLIFRKCIFVHLKENSDKFKLLCFCARKLFFLVNEKIKPEDLDNPAFQEILTCGEIYLMAIKESVTCFLNSVKHVITKKAKEDKFKLTQDIVQHCMNRSIPVTPQVKSMIMTGNIPGKNHGFMSNTGYSVLCKRTNILKFLSHFSAINRFSMKHYHKNARKFYPESWGFLCPVQTPEGENTGLHNHLALGCQIIPLGAPKVEPSALYSIGVLPYYDPFSYNEKIYPVILDGCIIGWVPYMQASNFTLELKHLRNIPKYNIPKHTEIILIPFMKKQFLYPGIFIFSTPCRMMRKVMNSETNEKEFVGTFEQPFLKISLENSGHDGIFESDNSSYLSLAAKMIPFFENNLAVRNILASTKSGQAIGIPFLNSPARGDSKILQLISPQVPLVGSKTYFQCGMDEYPLGTNVNLAVISYSGFDMEDAVVLNRASVERGLMQNLMIKSVVYDFEELAAKYYCKVSEMEFKRDPESVLICDFIDSDGLPYPGLKVRNGVPLLSIFVKPTKTFHIEFYGQDDKAYLMSVKLMGKTTSTRLPSESKKISLTFCIKRNPVVGDKFYNWHGQKGICGALFPPEDMPFTADGLVPDVLFNPHGLSSRMTVGMMLEVMAGKFSSIKASRHLITPFAFSDDNMAAEELGEKLMKAGYNYHGTERFYSGTSGNELEAHVFCGIMYYQRSYHMVKDKYQVRSTGEKDPITQQPMKCPKSGAIRVGEMERDAIISHGAALILLDRLLYNSDVCKAYICSGCRSLLYPVLENRLSKHDDENVNCHICDNSPRVYEIHIPYTLVYLIAEISAVGIKVEFSER